MEKYTSEKTNRKVIGTYQSGNTSREATIQNIQIAKYKSEKKQIEKLEIHKSENTHRKNTNRENTNRKIQSGNTTRKI